MLSYKRLDVYNCAIELLALAAEILESLAKITRIVEMLTKMCHFR